MDGSEAASGDHGDAEIDVMSLALGWICLGLTSGVLAEGRLNGMRAEGHRDEAIAQAVGRSTVAIQAMIVRLKQTDASIPEQRRRTWTSENLATVQRLQGEGLTHDQMARRLGTSSTRIGRMLAAAAQCPTEPTSPEPVEAPRSRLDPRQVVRELDNARAALERAERRYAEAMEPVHIAIRAAMNDCSDPQGDIAEYLCTALRQRGFMIVEASRA